jgi:high affinity Mn2+ porin
MKYTSVILVASLTGIALSARAQESAESHEEKQQDWNWHVQNTAVVQYHPGFPAAYSGPNSLDSSSEVKETISLDLMAGARLWRGAEAHADLLVWQGFGFSQTLGVEAFPNAEAFRLGTDLPRANLCRIFVRQDIGLGDEQETVGDDDLQLAGTRDRSRITLTLGRISVKDIFDNNAYANDARTQFMNWNLMANEAWDYPADSIGFMTGMAAELYQPGWALRYGFFQMPEVSNGMEVDRNFGQAWGMVTEFERRFAVNQHPGAVRLLAYLNSAHMGSYQEAIESPIRPADIEATRAYRYKYGFGLNVEQEVVENVGMFLRAGWSDGKTEAWTFADVDRTISLGVSIKGAAWHRPNDTYGLAGGVNGISSVHQQFFAAGGTGILGGDGRLTYGAEAFLETYYDVQVWKSLHAAVDYQFINNPAYNQDRGPVSVFSGRVHWSF